jgi:peroxiredoxin
MMTIKNGFRIIALLTTISVVQCFVNLILLSSPKESSSSAVFSSSMLDVTEVKVGDKIPSITMTEGLVDFEKKEVDIADLIAGKKVAIFGVPGAFTPGCSKSHLPSFITAQQELKDKGVEMTICIATNDAYVMEAWGRESGGKEAGIIFLSDSNAELSKALGLLMEGGIMPRTKRFSLIAEDGVVTHYFSSAEQSSDTWAPAVLAKL